VGVSFDVPMKRQGLASVHFSAQPEPFSPLNRPNLPLRKCSRRAEKRTSVSPCVTLAHFSAQPEPLWLLNRPNIPFKGCSRQAEHWTSVSPHETVTRRRAQRLARGILHFHYLRRIPRRCVSDSIRDEGGGSRAQQSAGASRILPSRALPPSLPPFHPTFPPPSLAYFSPFLPLLFPLPPILTPPLLPPLPTPPFPPFTAFQTRVDDVASNIYQATSGGARRRNPPRHLGPRQSGMG